MSLTAVLLLLGLLAAVKSAVELPLYIKTCSRNDPNLDECAMKNAVATIPFIVKGDRKYDFPSLDPLRITEIRVEEGNKSKRPIGLNFVMTDVKVYGFDAVQLKKIHFDLKNKRMELDMKYPEMRLRMNYEVDGKILILPLKGKGEHSVNMTDLGINYTLDYDLVTKKDGLEYIKQRNSTAVLTMKNMKIYLDNLFNGNKALGDNANRFLNENWQVLNDEILPYFTESFIKSIEQIFAIGLNQFAYRDIFPESV